MVIDPLATGLPPLTGDFVLITCRIRATRGVTDSFQQPTPPRLVFAFGVPFSIFDPSRGQFSMVSVPYQPIFANIFASIIVFKGAP
jgi:hypothetical protein